MSMTTYERAVREHFPRATCKDCLMPCNPHTREYRGAGVCPSCYDDLPPLKMVKKENPHGTVSK